MQIGTRLTALLVAGLVLPGCSAIYRPTAEAGKAMTRQEALTLFRHHTRRTTTVTETAFTGFGPSPGQKCLFAALDDPYVVRDPPFYDVRDAFFPKCFMFKFYEMGPARQVADAIYVLKHVPAPADSRTEEERFAETARQYRERTRKPALPEDARKYRVQAEAAVQAQRWNDALLSYAYALMVAPWWPEGHYNSAIIHAELNEYRSAIAAMGRYLALAPDAADARAAQDRIYQWEAQAKGG